jgi:NAD(P)-dependent dehydrogenase (short-subunit alcohol dehydrogenase family)
MTRLKGKTALITGATSGLGLAIARRYVDEGARVVFTGRNRDAGGRVEADLRQSGEAWFVEADAMDPESVERSVAFAVARLGDLAILVNNAGAAVVAKATETPLEDFDRVMDTNIRGYFLYGKACYPHLRERKGCMIHIASDAGIRGEQPLAIYSVSKAAVIMLSKMLALDGGPDGVRSNCLCPTSLLPGMRHMGPPGDPMRGDAPDTWLVPPVGRLGTVEDVTGAAVFFASADGEFCSGSVLLVDGGMQAGFRSEPPALAAH